MRAHYRCEPVIFAILGIADPPRTPFQSPALRDDRQKPLREIGILKQSVKIGSRDTARYGAVLLTIFLDQERIDRFHVIRFPQMDFIPRNYRTKKRAASRLNRDFSNIEFRLDRQQIQTALYTAFLGSARIRNLPSQHLIPTADAQDPTASLQNIKKQFLESSIDEPSQIGNRVLRAWNNQEVDGRTHLRFT